MGLETVKGYLFVRLDGEHVTFRSEGRKFVSSPLESEGIEVRRKPVDPPPALDLDAMGLPHLQPCCKGAKLKKGFQAPDFPGAVAVFHLPSLKVKGCHANAENVNTSRIDSNAAIENDGVLVIAATKNGQEKTIRVNGNATIVVAHLPVDVVTGKRGAGGNRHHYQAYYDMIDGGSCTPDYRGCVTLSKPTEGTCTESVARVRAESDLVASQPEDPPWDPSWSARTDIECSNTQWP